METGSAVVVEESGIQLRASPLTFGLQQLQQLFSGECPLEAIDDALVRHGGDVEKATEDLCVIIESLAEGKSGAQPQSHDAEEQQEKPEPPPHPPAAGPSDADELLARQLQDYEDSRAAQAVEAARRQAAQPSGSSGGGGGGPGIFPLPNLGIRKPQSSSSQPLAAAAAAAGAGGEGWGQPRPKGQLAAEKMKEIREKMGDGMNRLFRRGKKAPEPRGAYGPNLQDEGSISFGISTGRGWGGGTFNRAGEPGEVEPLTEADVMVDSVMQDAGYTNSYVPTTAEAAPSETPPPTQQSSASSAPRTEGGDHSPYKVQYKPPANGDNAFGTPAASESVDLLGLDGQTTTQQSGSADGATEI
ncbi:unnamed protein product [Vitrella brassicaformis CCMP3155]|uniref:CUE domain-containing protein n=1 Tax=Vitrella brassicaformis (strain CCMP3155) TaxID=1169540 RepID=A0A0G4GWI2_VITBC|nr:unnamed protein product [Vitrella brassicaformis CCMP3155]|eukprot:CEM35296.1 unnamed protein product [Vitrella brassicaformis CCMP3155]